MVNEVVDWNSPTSGHLPVRYLDEHWLRGSQRRPSQHSSDGQRSHAEKAIPRCALGYLYQ